LAEIANKIIKVNARQYELGLMYEKQEDFKKLPNAIKMPRRWKRDLSKTMMTNKYEDMIAKTPKK
jgi:hypothetical protein